MRTLDKAIDYANNGRVFPLCKSALYEQWGVEGDTGVWTVTVDKMKNTMICNCPNIRNTECKHLKSVKLIRDG
jgi:uncharacterized Zn finger protein